MQYPIFLDDEKTPMTGWSYDIYVVYTFADFDDRRKVRAPCRSQPIVGNAKSNDVQIHCEPHAGVRKRIEKGELLK